MLQTNKNVFKQQPDSRQVTLQGLTATMNALSLKPFQFLYLFFNTEINQAISSPISLTWVIKISLIKPCQPNITLCIITCISKVILNGKMYLES